MEPTHFPESVDADVALTRMPLAQREQAGCAPQAFTNEKFNFQRLEVSDDDLDDFDVQQMVEATDQQDTWISPKPVAPPAKQEAEDFDAVLAEHDMLVQQSSDGLDAELADRQLADAVDHNLDQMPTPVQQVRAHFLSMEDIVPLFAASRSCHGVARKLTTVNASKPDLESENAEMPEAQILSSSQFSSKDSLALSTFVGNLSAGCDFESAFLDAFEDHQANEILIADKLDEAILHALRSFMQRDLISMKLLRDHPGYPGPPELYSAAAISACEDQFEDFNKEFEFLLATAQDYKQAFCASVSLCSYSRTGRNAFIEAIRLREGAYN